jgi:acetate kinase
VEKLGWRGGTLDPAANEAGAPLISTREGRLAIHIVPADEEQTIARHTLALLPARGRR